jgi:hypothetical protein
MTGWIILAVLVAVALAAPRYGADTHTADSWTAGRDERPAPRARASVRVDLAAVTAALTRWLRRGAAGY